MKNKKKILILILILSFFDTVANSLEDFIFESKSIEIKKAENKILAKDGVKILTNNGLQINAKESIYDEDTRILNLIEDVIILDDIQKVEIKSQNIIYNKKIEKISSEDFTEILVNKSYTIQGKNITFLKNELIIYSDQITFINDKFNNQLEVNGFNFSLDSKILKTKNLKFTDTDSNLYKSNHSFIDLNNNKIAAKDIQIYFADGEMGNDARLKGSSMLSKKDSTIIKNGVFTACKIREECPPWVIKSEEVIHNKKSKTINYKNSWLKLYDIPVFYFPKFFHPDPTVKRQSGFLTPSIINSSINGSSLKIPYFNAISENKDLTITPRIYFNNDIMMQGEYRQVEKNTKHSSDFSLKKLDHNSKSHFFSNTKHNFETNFFDYSNLEINLEKTSNDTYLRGDNIISENRNSGNQSLLNSFVKYNSNNESLKISADLEVYEDLTVEKNSDKFQYIFPNFTITKLIDTKLEGSLAYKISGSRQQSSTNKTKNSLTNDLEYTSKSFFTKYGTISNYEVLFKNATKNGKNTDNDETKSKDFTSLIFTTELPLKKESANFISNFSPKISGRYNPSSPVENQNLDRKINITNIFSNNRLGLGDSLEGGQSLTVGFNYNLQDKNSNDLLGLSLGQIFRDTNNNKFPKKSMMQNKSSDIVGKFNFFPSDNFKINYDFSADNNLKTFNYNKIETEFSVNNFITSFDFLEENNEIGSESYLLTDIKYSFNNSNSLRYNSRRNRKINLTEFYNLIYEYKNDCLVAAIEYNKNYYQDRDLTPNEEIFFKLTIVPFSSVNSSNLK